MQLKPTQLEASLQQKLHPAYLIYGEEPWQLTLLADKVREAARRRGFTERLLYVVLPRFEWQEVALEAEGDLFAKKRLLDLIVPDGKVEREGARFLERFAKAPPPETLLLLTLESATPPRGEWFSALSRRGVVVRVERVLGESFVRWLERRAGRLGLRLEGEAARLLAFRTEGNLLAADQVLRLLQLLHGEGEISAEQVEAVVEENSYVQLFDWLGALLRGDAKTALHRLEALRREGFAPALVLWGLTFELRRLLELSARCSSLEERFRELKIWPKQQRCYREALARLSRERLEGWLLEALEIDRQVKGQTQGDPWLSLERITLLICSGNQDEVRR